MAGITVTNTWLGGTGDFMTATNWSLGHIPIATETVVFDGDISTLSTTFDATDGTSFVGLQLIDGYSGLVTLPFNITFGDFDMRCGLIAQPNSATDDLTVTGTFKFTGGMLNNSANTGTVHIIGVANAEMGSVGATVWTGSTISLEKYGATGTVLNYAGITIFNNDADLDIGAACQAAPKDPPTVPALLPELKTGWVADATKNLITVKTDGEFPTRTGGQTNMGILVENGGTLLVSRENKTQGDYAFLGKTSNDAGAPSVLVKHGGALKIRNGDKLTASNGVVIGQTELPPPGTALSALETLVRPESEGGQVATIDGKLTVLSGVVQLGKPYGDVGSHYSTLKVKDQVDFLGGTFKTSVMGGYPLLCDVIDTDKKIKFSATMVVDVLTNGTINSGDSWYVFLATEGVDATGAAQPPDPTGWDVIVSNYATNGKKIGVRKE
jgi:hypothetical protein